MVDKLNKEEIMAKFRIGVPTKGKAWYYVEATSEDAAKELVGRGEAEYEDHDYDESINSDKWIVELA